MGRIPQQASVLIVGAGPTGLMMAAQLLRYGVQPLIIDSRLGPTNQSKALAVQARTLEIYRQLGIAEKAIVDGKPAQGVTLNHTGKPLFTAVFDELGKGETAFPFVHFYEQSKNERLLLDHLTQNCCPVYWAITLTGVQQSGNKVSVVVKNDAGEQAIECDWLIGADGAHSTVRKQLNIPFNGDTYQHKFFLADVTLNGIPGDGVQLYMERKGVAAFFPMTEKDTYRIIGKIPPGQESNDNLQLADVLPALQSITGRELTIIKENWFTTYKLHHRMAAQFSQGRCFLAGDAAHIHSPVGGQGMNTGLQDAYNLGWKLAAVINKQMGKQILLTYEAERMPVARQLLNTTDRAFNLLNGEGFFAGLLKKWLVPAAARLLWGKVAFRKEFFKRLSQINISYRDSKLSLHLSQQNDIKAGDRLPYIKVFDEKKQQETDLHAWCAKPGFTLIVLGKFKEIDIFTLAKWITQNYSGLLNLFYLPPSAKNVEVFERFKTGPQQKKALIVRPDMHIGYLNDVVDIDMMDNYLRNAAGFIKQA